MHGSIKHRSAGIVVVRQQDGGWWFLLLRAYRNWDFPKGLLEPGEKLLAAAQRETEEETGLRDLDFHWGTESIDTEMYGDHKVASYYLAQTGQDRIVLPVNPELGHPEHNEFRWVTYKEAQVLLPALVRARVEGDEQQSPVLAAVRGRQVHDDSVLSHIEGEVQVDARTRVGAGAHRVGVGPDRGSIGEANA